MKRANLYVNPKCKNYDYVLRELKLGYLNIKDGFYDVAQSNFDLVLASDKTCADAYWGLLLSKLQVNDESVFHSEKDKYSKIFKMKEYQDALKFANESQKELFLGIVKDIPGNPNLFDDDDPGYYKDVYKTPKVRRFGVYDEGDLDEEPKKKNKKNDGDGF